MCVFKNIPKAVERVLLLGHGYNKMSTLVGWNPTKIMSPWPAEEASFPDVSRKSFTASPFRWFDGSRSCWNAVLVE